VPETAQKCGEYMDNEIRTEFIEAGVDVDEALHRFMNKDELFVRFMKEYLDDNNLEMLKRSIADENAGDAFNYAHTLKGVAGNLSMKSILHYLLPAVEILRAGSLDGLGTYIDGVTKANDQIISVIKEL
jgi:hypothetical protein